MKLRILFAAAGLALATAACSDGADSEVASAHASEIAWREGDVDDALTEAKEAGKPVILYWGAVWCPPCNQMKSTLFKDPGFIAETENFIPVYLDGDTEGAQKWGERFNISGYPTVIILSADGTEITRIASATMADELPDLLQVAASRTTSIEDLLATAEDDTSELSADDWKILAGFDWLNDPKHFSDLKKAGTLLDRLGKEAPEPEMRRSFGLLALAVNLEPGEDGKLVLSDAQRADVTSILTAMLANDKEIMANRQALTFYVPDMVLALPEEPRKDLSEKLIAAMDAIYANEALSLTDRVDSIYAEIELTKDAEGNVPPEVLAKTRARARWADNTATSLTERQSVIDDAAYFLDMAGDTEAAKKLLLAELDKSESPYYYMSTLSSIAEDEGDKQAALDWRRKAYEASQGPATRVQWAINWSNAVMRIAPEDMDAMEAAANAVIGEIAKSPDSYYQRTRMKVDAWGDGLRKWAEANGGGEVLDALRTEMADVCAQQGSQADTCNEWSKA